jgi:PAS domain S-box-containing protein
MSVPLRALIVEDSEGDAALITLQLRDSGYAPDIKRITTPEALRTALADATWDIVIADYFMPRFSGLDTLAMAKACDPDLPLIIVSGVIGEDTAVAAVKAGAYDYVMKDNLARLGTAVQHALQEAQAQRARRQAEEALRESEEMYKTLVKASPDSVVLTDLEGHLIYVSQRAVEQLGFGSADELLGRNGLDLIILEDREQARDSLQRILQEGMIRNLEYTLVRKDGSRFIGEFSAALVESVHQRPKAFVITVRDVTERKRVEKALRLGIGQLAALSQASQAVTASLELDQVLARIVSLANDVAIADYTGVVLVDEAGRISQSTENLPGVPALQYRIRDNGLTNWIVCSRQAVIVDEIHKDGRMSPRLGRGAPRAANPLIVESEVKSLAGMPLLVKDRLLGVLYLHSLQPGAFHDQLPLLTAFASQVAIAIENARLFQAEQQQARRLALLADIARIAATTHDADALPQAVAESIRRHFAYPMVGLFTLDDEGQTLALRGYAGMPLVPPELMTPGAYRLPITQGVNGYVARTGRSYLVPDVHTDPYFVNPSNAPIRAALCTPLLDKGRVIGTINVESDRLADFDEEDRSLLEAVADTVAIGLRNARLYQETRRQVQELRFLNRLSIGFEATLDVDTMINSALEGLHELMKADRTYFVTANLSGRSWEMTHEWAIPGIQPDIGLSGTFDDAPAEAETLITADQPFAVFDVATDPRIEATRDNYLSLGTQSMLMVPVQVGGRFYGALGFDHCREKHNWRPDEIRLLEAVAHQLGLGLDNAHLFEEVRLRADELAAALARLEEMDRLKDQFIQNVSHELRSPLALIRGYAEMLNSYELGSLQPEQQKPVAVIARRARMLGDLVRDITLILEAEVHPPEPEAVPLDELAQAAVEDFQVAAEQADLKMRTEIASHLPPASGAPTYLRRVLDNLLGNAVKFTPAGGTIVVRVWQENEQVVLEVSDTGIGIPAEQLERIFERFYQVDGSVKRRYGGVGLGLALVKQITETYGGHVTVKSQVGEGSTFAVTLPIFTDTGGTEESDFDSIS